MCRRGSVCAAGTVALLLSAAANAAPVEFTLLLDLDSNPATGCSAHGFDGAEQLVITTIEKDSPSRVVSITRSVCASIRVGVNGGAENTNALADAVATGGFLGGAGACVPP